MDGMGTAPLRGHASRDTTLFRSTAPHAPPGPNAAPRTAGTLFTSTAFTVLVLASCTSSTGQDTPPQASLPAVLDQEIGPSLHPNLELFDPVALLPVSEHHIVVLESRASHPRTLVLDRDTAVIPMGREGDGPGEFRRPSRIGRTADGFWISDSRTNRITVFDRSLRHDSTLIPPPLSVSPPYGQGTRALSLRNEVVAIPSVNLSQTEAGREFLPPMPILLLQDNRWDTLALVTYPTPTASVSMGPSGTMHVRIPFIPPPLYALSPSGEFLASASYDTPLHSAENLSITVHTLSGPQVRSVTHDLVIPRSDRSIPRASLDQALSTLESSLSELSRQVPALPTAADILRSIDIPSRFPPFDRIYISDDASVWLRLGDRSGLWQVIHRDSRTSRIHLPGVYDILHMDDEYLWATESDSEYSERILRLSVP